MTKPQHELEELGYKFNNLVTSNDNWDVDAPDGWSYIPDVMGYDSRKKCLEAATKHYQQQQELELAKGVLHRIVGHFTEYLMDMGDDYLAEDHLETNMRIELARVFDNNGEWRPVFDTEDK